MVQMCSKCSRANPPDAVYCHYDGLVLGGHSRNGGGPVAVGAQSFANPFVFPSGKACRSFNELALTCQSDWTAARDLLQQGYLETFFGGLGRIDLAMAAKEAARFPDKDRGLDQLLAKLPSDVLAEPTLKVETQEINLGVLSAADKERSFDLHLENQGMRLLYGAVTCTDAVWLTLGDGPGATEKHFQFGHDGTIPLRVVPDRLRASNKPLEAHLIVESNGGTVTVVVKAEVPVKPFPDGVLAGAKSPRQVAEKAKLNPKEAAPQFEKGEVAAWYKSNGWIYPVQGPSASGLAAVQQFFEALGLTPPPKVEINVRSLSLSGGPGETLRATLEVKTEEKKPIFAHATCNQSWLEVGRTKVTGRVATIGLAVPSVPNKPGQTLTAKVVVQSNGNQRFVVPVTLQVAGAAGGNAFDFDAPEPVPVLAAADVEEAPVVAKAPSPVTAAPGPARGTPSPKIQTAPAPAPSGGFRTSARGRSVARPMWVHAIPAGLLALALLIVVIVDLALGKSGPGPNGGPDVSNPGDLSNPLNWKFSNVSDPDPKLGLSFNDKKGMRFGLVMLGVQDPRPGLQDKFKKLTYEESGATNNTRLYIDGYELLFGDTRQTTNKWVRGREKVDLKAKGRHGTVCEMTFNIEGSKILATQHVEIVPGQGGKLDTCLVWYTVKNASDLPHTVGLRFMLDTFIGANDGVPFTVPGRKGFIDGAQEFSQKEIPQYIEAVEKPDDPKDPGTVARLGLQDIRLPGVNLEEIDKMQICAYPGNDAFGYEMKKEDMQSIKDKNDSCVFLYWTKEKMNPGDVRNMAFTYGLSRLDIGEGGGGALALSAPDTVAPDADFVVTAYVYNAQKGNEVELRLPAGLALAPGEAKKKTVEETGPRVSVFWHVRAGAAGTYPIDATSGGTKSKPREVVVKIGSLFG